MNSIKKNLEKAILSMSKFVFGQRPRVYGITYILLIPIFAAIYSITPQMMNEELQGGKALYFSTVTITTLGYGEIHPRDDWGRFFTGLEAFLGVTLIGLFLNSLSRSASDAATTAEKAKQEASYLKSQIAKLRGHWRLMDPVVTRYMVGVQKLIGNNSEGKINRDFTLNDLKKFDELVAITTHGLQVTKIEYYYEQLDTLTDQLSFAVRNIDLNLFSDLEEDCIEFIQTSHDFNSAGFLIQSRNQINENIGDLLRAAIDVHDGSVELQHSSILNPIIFLHKQIQAHIDLLDRIGNAIVRITELDTRRNPYNIS